MWHVEPIISESEGRTTSGEIADMLNDCEAEGLKLVAATGGFLFFKSFETSAPALPPREVPPPREVVYEAEPEEDMQTKPVQRRGKRPPPKPDPSIRPGGSDINFRQYEEPESTPLPQASPQDPNDPFGLGG